MERCLEAVNQQTKVIKNGAPRLGIGEILRQGRVNKRLTQTSTASLAGVPRRYLSLVERGLRSPEPEVLIRLAHQLDISSGTWVPCMAREEYKFDRLAEIGRALLAEDDFKGAGLALARALSIGRRGPDTHALAEVHHLVGQLHFQLGRYERALTAFERYACMAEHIADPTALGTAAYRLGRTLGMLGQGMDAIRKFEQSARLFGSLHMPSHLGHAWLGKAEILFHMHLYADALESYQRAGRLLRRMPFRGQIALGSAVCSLAVLGPEAGLRAAHDVMSLREADPATQAIGRECAAVALRHLKRYDGALAELADALICRQQLAAELVAGLLAEREMCQTLTGDRDGARRTVEEYRLMQDSSTGVDLGAMNILALVLGVEPVDSPIPSQLQDGPAQRLTTALALLYQTSDDTA